MTSIIKQSSKHFSKWLVGVVLGCSLLILVLVQKIIYLSAPPGKDKDCLPLYPENISSDKATIIALLEAPFTLLQKGGIINDASCLDQTSVYGIVAIHTEEDISNALIFARTHNLKVSIAGVKHSMGGQAFAKGNLVLDMTNFNSVQLNESQKTITVQSGATWHNIQSKIHPHYAISAMQSTDIFTVGGSLSVNAHGMDHTIGAVENSVVSLRIMLPDGDIKRLSRNENTDLYNLVIGGYGLFGVILDAELRVVNNDLYESSRKILNYQDFPTFFKEEIQNNPNIGLTYTHLSTAPNDTFLKEGIVYLYTKSEENISTDQIPPLGEVSSVPLRRFVMNLSKYGSAFQTVRWWSEKYLEPKMESCSISRNQAQSSGEACLVARNEPMHDSVPYLKNSLKKETDILHEYFIPREQLVSFIDGLREIMITNHANLLNASIRVVNQERGVLTYAPEEAFSVVLYINQKTDAQGNADMRKVTGELIDLAVQNKGRFFLPYQLYYTPEQLQASYPNIGEFFALKRAYDPEEMLTNTWYEKYGHSFQ